MYDSSSVHGAVFGKNISQEGNPRQTGRFVEKNCADRC